MRLKHDKKTVHHVHTSILTAIVRGICCYDYWRISCWLCFKYVKCSLMMFYVVVLPNVETAIFRSVGDTKVPLKTLVVSGIINVILNLLFVIVLKMTVNGVAIAIVISNLISAIILLNKLIKTDQYTHVNLKDLKSINYHLLEF